jgi:hypothetical protein
MIVSLIDEAGHSSEISPVDYSQPMGEHRQLCGGWKEFVLFFPDGLQA